MLIAIVVIFCIGYAAIAFEHKLHINKAAAALMMGVLCWTFYILDVRELLPVDRIPDHFAAEAAGGPDEADIQRHFAVEDQLLRLTGEIAGILFFLLGAMTIVELVDAHEGFAVITDRIRPRSKRRLLWSVAWLAFFLSAVLDNLTTTIVMISLMRKLLRDRDDRLLLAGVIVIAANAGGAWTVIGDVTTTMLWIKQKITTFDVMGTLLLPSLACLLVPLLVLSRSVRGPIDFATAAPAGESPEVPRWHQRLFLTLGIGGLLFVPAFKMITHLPPYLGMMFSLSVLWVVSELVNRSADQELHSSTGVLAALKRIDMSAILFFLGILLAVGALAATGLLLAAAAWLQETVPSLDAVAVIIGLISAVVDNVPLVAAGIEMYTLPVNDRFWMLLAYTAGTGGSCLIIGSAAGVAAMGLERIDFLWYVRRIAPLAAAGYFSGVAVFLLQEYLLRS